MNADQQQRRTPSGGTATSMNGRRRPSGVWNESLHGPMIGESVSAKRPSAPSDDADQRRRSP